LKDIDINGGFNSFWIKYDIYHKIRVNMQYNSNFNPIISDDKVFSQIKKEQETIGYYKLPFQSTQSFKQYAKTVMQKHIAVVGIGGSTLGTFAIYDFLK